MFQKIKNFLIGKPLQTSDTGKQSLTNFKALALLSSDALSSTAYGTETILVALMAGGVTALWLQIPISILVVFLLFAIVISYQQIIKAYPNGGGAYAVAHENWGANAGLIAGGSLLVDYMLTVSVSSSAAADAITSAIHGLEPYSIEISIIIILLLMTMNLRGLQESANFLLAPVYLFILSISAMLIYGIYQVVTGQIPLEAPSKIGTYSSSITFVLFMKGFSSGSSSLTGVEAISNAVPNFKKPKEKNASRTLALMASILGIFFLSLTFLSYWYGIVPGKTTVLSQIASKTFGSGSFGFYLIQLATSLVLMVAANTGFSAFPMLSYNLAKDKYMPNMYKDKGARLGYSNGIISLTIGAIVLILIFRGSTDSLIPLYALGVFVPFTLSQSGMVKYWFKKKSKHWFFKSILNFIGALLSFILVITMIILRFKQIWPYFIVMPLVVLLFKNIHNHYLAIAEQLRIRKSIDKHLKEEGTIVKKDEFSGSMVIVLISSVTEVADSAIENAKSIGDEVIAVHVSFDDNPQKEKENEREFKETFPDVRYVDIHSSYRSVLNPVETFVISMIKPARKKNYSLTVLIPQFVPKRPWQNMLHNHNAFKLRTALSRYNGIIVASFYYHLRK